MTVVYDNFTKRTYSTSEPFDVTPQRHLPEPCAANQQASNKQHNNEDGPFSCLADAALRNDSAHGLGSHLNPNSATLMCSRAILLS